MAAGNSNLIPNGNSILVNTHTNYEGQYHSHPIQLQNGELLVLFEDWTELGFAQAIAPDGTAAGEEFALHRPEEEILEIEVQPLRGDQFLVLAAVQDTSYSLGYSMVGRVFDSAGTIIRETFFNPENPPQHISLSLQEDGSYLASWTDDRQPGSPTSYQDGSGEGIFAQRVASDGTLVGEAFQINQTSRYDQSSPSSATLSNGHYVVTWEGETDVTSTSRDELLGRILRPDGSFVGGEFRLNTYDRGDQEDIAVAALSGGGFVVVWTSTRQDVYYSESGSRWESSGIYGRIFDNAGNATTDEFRINTASRGGQSDATISALDTGGFIVSWITDGWDTDADDGLWDVAARVFDGNGFSYGDEFLVHDVAEGSQLPGGITQLASGDLFVTWASTHLGNGYDVMAQQFTFYEGRTLEGTAGDDRLIGGAESDTFNGLAGNDFLQGGDGPDALHGGDGADTLIGADGHDTLIGGNSEDDVRDVVYGGTGDDSLDGGYGNDELRGDDGNDTIEGGFGADTVIGGNGNDLLTGSAWSDV
ncbi:calcium-binding protein, partial [Shimia sp. SDUM112013]|uniref:calcium-binding protein n=1 Tax=Shimia sp. SDUM112013 TaxID=3136160 RepID=UPI0032EFA81A